MKVFWKKYSGVCLAFALAAASFLAVCLIPAEKGEDEAEKRVIRVWNVDTFEGGKGSRTAFLKAAARRAEKGREGVYYLVSSYTAEGAEEAFRAGDAPDAISFGIGLSVFAERSLPLPHSFSGGEIGGETRAYPWCRGGYFLFSPDEDFEREGRTAISSGGSNLPEVAASLSGISGEALPALSAYTAFLGGKFRYLLGTQRDLCRFRARGVSVCARPLSAYCDLYQYYSVLSAERREDCLALLEELLSERTQAELEEIGMYSVRPPGEEGMLTAGVFLSAEALGQLRLAAGESGGKNLGNYLKTV